MDQLLLDFLEEVDDINGFYLDCKAGLHAWNEKVIDAQTQISKITGEPDDQIDDIDLIYGEGDNPRDQSSWRHKSTQGEVKRRTAKDGTDTIMAARLCLVTIYQLWEIYRKKLEKEHCLGENSIEHDIMGDMRYFRHSILKNRGRAIPEITRCKLLKWFNAGDEIVIDDQKFKYLIDTIKNAAEEIDREINR